MRSKTRLSEIGEFSSEQLEKLELYESLLRKWNKQINLVAESTIDEIWERHFLDSAQLLKYFPESYNNLTDFGSGGGFPAIVLAILGAPNVTLIESIEKKCVFLNEVIRQTDIKAHVINERVEDISPWKSDIITARAFAPLDKLLGYVFPFCTNGSSCYFLKGKSVHEEISQLKSHWKVTEKFYKSIVSNHDNSSGWVLELKNIEKSNG